MWTFLTEVPLGRLTYFVWVSLTTTWELLATTMNWGRPRSDLVPTAGFVISQSSSSRRPVPFPATFNGNVPSSLPAQRDQPVYYSPKSKASSLLTLDQIDRFSDCQVRRTVQLMVVLSGDANHYEMTMLPEVVLLKVPSLALSV